MISDDDWKKLIRLHQLTKKYFLKAEESDESLKTWFPPINEHRYAYDHLMRVKAREYGFRSSPDEETQTEEEPLTDEDYIQENFRTCLNHEMRAFYDAVERLAISLRDSISTMLDGYSPSTITKALPDWYTEIKPALIKINDDIALQRERKDVGDDRIGEI